MPFPLRKAVAGLFLGGALLAPLNTASADQCTGLVAHLTGRAEVRGFRDGPVINESAILMRKPGSSLYGNWIAAHTVDIQTFPHAVPDLAGTPAAGTSVITRGDTKLSCRTTKPGPGRFRSACTGRLPFTVTRNGIFMGKSFRVGKVTGQTLELSMLPGQAHWPVVRGKPMPADKVRFDARARSSTDQQSGGRYRLIVQASVTPADLMPYLRISHGLEEAARLSGTTLRAAAPERSEDGSVLRLVADFPGLLRPNETIQEATVRIFVDFEDCTRERTLSVAELLLL